jgi:hypothetical protein
MDRGTFRFSDKVRFSGRCKFMIEVNVGGGLWLGFLLRLEFGMELGLGCSLGLGLWLDLRVGVPLGLGYV